MLSKSRRLRSAEVRKISAMGRAARGVNLSARILKTQGRLRAAAVVSKSVAKSAVMRNRLRRALYRALLGVEGSGQAVFFLRKVPSAPLAPTLRAEIEGILRNVR